MSKQTEINVIVEEFAVANTAQQISGMDLVLDASERLVAAKATTKQIAEAAKAVAKLPHVTMTSSSADSRLREGVKYVKADPKQTAASVKARIQAFNVERCEDGKTAIASLQNADLKAALGVKTIARATTTTTVADRIAEGKLDSELEAIIAAATARLAAV